jgi:hypothetical protein
VNRRHSVTYGKSKRIRYQLIIDIMSNKVTQTTLTIAQVRVAVVPTAAPNTDEVPHPSASNSLIISATFNGMRALKQSAPTELAHWCWMSQPAGRHQTTPVRRKAAGV